MLCVLFFPPIQGAQDATTYADNTKHPEIDYHSKELDKENRYLPGNKIKCLSETKDGGIWIGTDKGLANYNKGKGQIFTKENSRLPGNVVSALLNEENGSLWVGINEFVALYPKGNRYDFSKEELKLPVGKVNAIIEGKDGKIWVGAQGGLSYFYNGKWQELMDRDRRPFKSSVNALVETSDGALWVGTDSGLKCFYKGKWQDLTDKDRKFPNTTITALLRTRNYLWIGTDTGLGRLNIYKGAWETSTYEEKGGLNTLIITLGETRDGLLWVGTGEGLWRFENDSFKLFKKTKGDRLEGRLACLLDSSDGALWVGTDRGLFRIQKSRWQIFTPGNSQLPGILVRALLTTQDGTLWAGTDKGLAYFDEEEWQIFSDDESGIKEQGVLAIAEMEDGNLWVGFEHGLVIIQNGNIQKTLLDDERFIDINAFMMTAYKTFWIGTDKGLYRYRKGIWKLLKRNNNRISGVNALLKAKDRSLWLGTEDGLFCYHMGEWKDVKKLKDTNITALVQMDDKTYWAGSKFDEFDGSPGGLYYSKDGEWTYFEEFKSKNIEDNYVSVLLKADEEVLWVGAKIGLARIHNKSKEMQRFTVANSDLNNNSITALSLGADGSLWIGTEEGAARFRPPDPKEERPIVELIIPFKKKVLTQREQTFTASTFDPKYQTESHIFKFHWEVISEAGKVIHRQDSEKSSMTYIYEDGCSYTVKVFCSDCYGYRSASNEFQFKIDLSKLTSKEGSTKPGTTRTDISKKDTNYVEPKKKKPQKPDGPKSDSLLVKVLKIAAYTVLLAVILYSLYLVPLFPLVAFYHKHEWAKNAVNSAIYNKLPLGHKTVLNMRWSRWYIFSQPMELLKVAQYIPKDICQYYPPIIEDIENIQFSKNNLKRSLAALFKGRQHAMIIGPDNSGKSGLLYYIHNLMVARFKEKRKIKKELPVLIDIGKADIENQSIEEMIYDVFDGQSIDLSREVINFMLRKGRFIIFIDSLDRGEGPVIGRVKAFLTRNHNLKNRILMASRDDILERDDINLFIWCTETVRKINGTVDHDIKDKEGERPEKHLDIAYTAFISFEGKDRPSAQRLVENLKKDGVRVWMDDSEFKGGEPINKTIIKAIDKCPAFIPLISQHSKRIETNDGKLKYHIQEWQRVCSNKEAGAHVEIIPVKIDNTKWVYDKFTDIYHLKIPDGKRVEDYEKLRDRLKNI